MFRPSEVKGLQSVDPQLFASAGALATTENETDKTTPKAEPIAARRFVVDPAIMFFPNRAQGSWSQPSRKDLPHVMRNTFFEG